MLKIDELFKHQCTAAQVNYLGVALYNFCIIITIMKLLLLEEEEREYKNVNTHFIEVQ